MSEREELREARQVMDRKRLALWISIQAIDIADESSGVKICEDQRKLIN